MKNEGDTLAWSELKYEQAMDAIKAVLAEIDGPYGINGTASGGVWLYGVSLGTEQLLRRAVKYQEE